VKDENDIVLWDTFSGFVVDKYALITLVFPVPAPPMNNKGFLLAKWISMMNFNLVVWTVFTKILLNKEHTLEPSSTTTYGFNLEFQFSHF